MILFKHSTFMNRLGNELKCNVIIFPVDLKFDYLLNKKIISKT